MSEFWHGLGLVLATALFAGAVTFGLRAGIEFAHWVFGPFNINVKRGDQNIIIRSSDAAQHQEPEGK